MSNSRSKKHFEIINKDFSHGMQGSVSIVKRESDGELFVLKTPIEDNYEHHRDFRREIRNARFWRKLGISKIDVKWDQDKKCLLKTYVNGKTLAQIEKENPLFFSKTDDRPVRELGKMLKHLIDEKYYVGDMSPDNMIYDGKIWQIVDSGSVHKRSSRSALRMEYKENLTGKWSRDLTNEGIYYLERFLDKWINY
jgi:tRNA A-37 threonylcarbamoyl transferase component Bud32